MNDTRAAIEAWRDVYLAVAGAAAVLLGLLFVAGSIRHAAVTRTGRVIGQPGWQHLLLNRYRFDSDDLRLATQTYVMFIYTLVFSLTMLVPDDPPFAPALTIVAFGLLGLVETLIPIGHALGRQGERAPWFELLWRYGLPLASMLLVVGGGVALAVDQTRGLEAIAMGVGLLVFGATRNAWDYLLILGSGGDDT